MKKSISLLLLSLLMITPSCQKPKEVTNEYNIVPQPNQLVPKEGRFELSNKVRLVVPSDAPEVKKVADGFAEQLKQTAGISLKDILRVRCTHPASVTFLPASASLNSPHVYVLNISFSIYRHL